MKNNNQKIISRLSRRSLEHNRMRNLFAVLSIALTCMLFTTLFSFGIGMAKVTQEQTMREVGGKYHAGLKSVTLEQFETIVKDPRIVDHSANILISFAENILQRSAEIRFPLEAKELSYSFIELEEGRLPETEDEIVVDTLVLDALGVPHKLGANVPLVFSFHGETIEKTFTLSGYYQGDQISHASQCYISESYFKTLKGSLTDDDFLRWANEHPEDAGQGLYNVGLYFKTSSNIEETITSILSDAGYDPGADVDYGVNWAYMESRLDSVDPLTLSMLFFALLIILLTGYLMIYNIFQISVINDIRFYGLLKTIGTTKKQIRSLIFRQAMVLSLLGIPLGLFLGSFISIGLFPFAMSFLENGGVAVQLAFSPAMALFGALFSLLTVLLSCRKPGKIAGSVSPIEAIRYTEGTIRRKREKHSESGAKLPRMALSNLGRNRQKTVFVILSLSLSISLLCVILTGVASFRLDRYLSARLLGDVTIGNVSYTGNGSLTNDFTIDPNYLSLLDSQPGILSRYEMWRNIYSHHIRLSDEALKRYEALRAKGILREEETYQTWYIENTLEKRDLSVSAYGYDKELLSNLTVLEGELDTEKFLKGGYCLVTPIQGADNTSGLLYKPGDKLTIQSVTETSVPKEVKDEKGNTIDVEFSGMEETEYEIMAVVEIPSSMDDHLYQLNSLEAIFPKEVFQKDALSGQRFAVSYTLEEEALAPFIDRAKAYSEQKNPYMGFLSKESLIQEFSGMTTILKTIGISLCAVISLIGVLNFINSIFTGILSRKREFAILLSIGMTQKQLKQMLLTEGLFYVLLSGLVSIPFGSLLSYLTLKALNQVILFFEYRYNFSAFVIMLPLFLVIALAAPALAYRKAARSSIVERLHDTEN